MTPHDLYKEYEEILLNVGEVEDLFPLSQSALTLSVHPNLKEWQTLIVEWHATQLPKLFYSEHPSLEPALVAHDLYWLSVWAKNFSSQSFGYTAVKKDSEPLVNGITLKTGWLQKSASKVKRIVATHTREGLREMMGTGVAAASITKDFQVVKVRLNAKWIELPEWSSKGAGRVLVHGELKPLSIMEFL